MDLPTVAIASIATVLATGLGALPLVALREATDRVVGVSTAIAAGLMLAATQLLVSEGADLDPARTAIGMGAGAIMVWLLARSIHAHEDDHLVMRLRAGGLRSSNALLVVGVMTVHSAAEGIGVGVSFAGGGELGLLVTAAIAVHNIPEGLAISLALVPSGSSVRAAAAWSIASSVPQALLAVPAFLFVEHVRAALPVGLGLAGGAMLWMVAFELIPDAARRVRGWPLLAGLAAGYAAMLAFTLAIGH